GFLLSNLWPAFVFGVPLATRMWSLRQRPVPTNLHEQAFYLQEVLTIIFLGLVVVLFMVRRRGLRSQHAGWRPGVVALVGTFLLNLVAYIPVEQATATALLLTSSVIVMLGTVFSIWSLATLGRNFGIFPEVRGLVRSGPYHLVRHPIYVGEIVSGFGVIVIRPSVFIAAIFILFVILQYWRTVFEERALSGAFPSEYPSYRVRVPRLIPGWHD
ncbi:MAG: isoprenylcysteine carboxylmethyltransferase family protein, partial [Chloroflexi bacterium]|nr:isoprenylcysteine carboxylmethyltransferase family protein [Chloroflexota bacterium]